MAADSKTLAHDEFMKHESALLETSKWMYDNPETAHAEFEKIGRAHV